MSDSKQLHIERKNRVLECLSEAKKFTDENGYKNESASIEAQYNNVMNGEFSIAVVGEFSAGKSTFLNAMMGERLLPSFTRETTATINFLRHKDKSEDGAEACVFYNNGEVLKIDHADADTIKKYVATNIDGSVTGDISHVDLYLDNKFLKDNVTLVDTPGLNGTREGHAEMTRQQIEKSSASIFLFNARQPGSKSNFEALSMLRKKVKSIFLVLNGIDGIKSDESDSVESVIKTLKDKYKNDYPEEKTVPEIIPISALKALVARSSKPVEYNERKDFSPEEKSRFEEDSGMQAFEDRLWKYLTQGEKGRQMLIGPLDQLLSVLSDIGDLLTQEENALDGKLDAEEVQQNIINLEKAIADLEEQMKNQMRELSPKLRQCESEFKEEIESEASSYRDRYLKQIDTFTDLDEINPDSIIKKINNQFMTILKTAYRHYSMRIEELVADCNGTINDELNDLLSRESDISIQRAPVLTTFDTGLEKFEEKLAQLESDMANLETELDEQNISVLKQRRLERERASYEKQISEIKASRDYFSQNAMMVVPAVRYTQQTEDVEIPRGGLLGGLATILVGKRYEMRTVSIADTSERDAYMQQLNSNLSRYDNDIDEIKSKLSQCGNPNSEEALELRNQIERRLNEKRAQGERLQAEYAEKLREKCAKQLRRQKEEISEYIWDATNELTAKADDEFRSSRSVQLKMLEVVISGSVREQIELKKREMDLLKERIGSAEEEKNERMNQIRSQRDILGQLYTKAQELHDELDAMDIDEIKEETL